jgi:hypothetical protein
MLRDDLHAIITGAPFDFDQVALRVFAHQYERCQPFRAFCDRRGARPDKVRWWKDVPPLPVDAFKRSKIYCGDGEPEKVFLTSGTTNGPEMRGKHHFGSMDLMREGERETFKRVLLPEVDEIRLLMLAAPPEVAPASVMVWYLATAIELFGRPGSSFFVDQGGLQLDALGAALADATAKREAVALLGTPFAFVHALDAGLRAALPPGSFVVHMGGFKGRSRELEREALHGFIRERLGVRRVVNNYSMTEVSTQFYGDEHHVPPRWAAVRILDPDTLQDVPDGQRGLIAVADLVNLDACAFIVTQDVGERRADGAFKVYGRVAGAEPRGCALAMDEFLLGVKA